MSPFQHAEKYLQAVDGIRLYSQSWQPEKPIGKTLILAHGLGEHSGRYQNVVEYFASKGYAIYAQDHRGHGRSEGRRGHIRDFQEYVEDLRLFFEYVSSQQTPDDIYLLGHSLGGLIALQYALKYQRFLKGLILSSPALQIKIKIPPIKATLGRWLSRLWPTLSMANGIDSTHLSHVSQVVAQYRADALVHNRVTTRYFSEFMAAITQTHEKVSQLTLPTLLMHAGDDQIVDPAGTKAFYQKMTSDDKQLIIYDGFYHEIFNEKEHQGVLADVEQWLKQH